MADTVSRQAGTLHLASLSTRLAELRTQVRRRHGFVDRIALALHDPDSGRLTTLIDPDHAKLQSLGAGYPVADLRALAALADDGKTHLLDAPAIGAVDHEASRLWAGYRSSLAHPVTVDDKLLGLLLFDSRASDVFDTRTVEDLGIYAHLLATIVSQELTSVQMMVGGLRLARNLAHLRDIETGAHLDRMSHYARLIAREIAGPNGFDNDFVEHVFLFAPLHDVGKVGIPDCILLKPGKLSDGERRIMDGHVALGVDMVDRMIRDFGLGRLPQLALLRNIVAHHHEYLDGSGYPNGLGTASIPLEARIVAAADVLDALCCTRSYKKAWPMRDALAEVSRMSGTRLDPQCVDALLRCRDEVEAIHDHFELPAERHP